MIYAVEALRNMAYAQRSTKLQIYRVTAKFASLFVGNELRKSPFKFGG